MRVGHKKIESIECLNSENGAETKEESFRRMPENENEDPGTKPSG